MGDPNEPAPWADETQGRPLRRNWLRWLVVVLVLAVAGLAALPAYRALKNWRAERFAGEARQLAAGEDMAAAFQRAQAAYQLAPHNAEVLRTFAQVFSAVGGEQALPFWEQLISLPESGMEDRRNVARLALSLGRYDLMGEQMRQLMKMEPEHAENLLLSAEFYAGQGDREEAVEYAGRAVEKEPENEVYRLVLGRLLSGSHYPSDQLEAKRLLLELGKADSGIGLEAVVLATRLPNLTGEEMSFLLARLREHPEALERHDLVALELEIRSQPDASGRMIEEAVRQLSGVEAKDKLSLGRWLNSTRRYRETLELLELEEALQNQDLFLVYVDALSGLGEWSRISEIFEEREVPLENFLAELFQARTAIELRDMTKAGLHWRRVHMEVGDSPKALRYVAQYAERLGFFDEALKAYGKLAEHPAHGADAYRAMVRVAEAADNTVRLREIMREIAAAFPDESAPRNDLAYLNLLLNENVEPARETAKGLVEKAPTMLAHRVTLALAYLRLNQPDFAREVLDVEVSWSETLPGWQAVHAAVRGAVGETNLAKALARQIPLERLKLEERFLVQPYL